MLQSMLVKRIERVANLRALLVLHVALYTLALIAFVTSGAAGATALLLAAWLPVLLAHLVSHTLYEVRERCAVQPQPAPAFYPAARTVDLYDEQGKLVSSDSNVEYLPRPRS